MSLTQLLDKIHNHPEQVSFDEVIDCIDEHYHYTATQFSNGLGDNVLVSEAGSNEGSCKIFAFGLLNDLNEAQTLACFGQYYRQDVLANLSGKDHGNIRNFMKYGWSGIHFEQPALIPR